MAMRDRERKKYREAFAALILAKVGLIDRPFPERWLNERPDLQFGSFGIEETEAINGADGEQRKIDVETLKCKTYEDALAYRNSKKQTPELTRSELRPAPGNRSSLMSGGGWNPDIAQQPILDAITKKSRLFPTYPDYSKYTQRGLFISIEDLALMSLPLETDPIQAATDNSIFDVVFLLRYQAIMVFRKNGQQIEEYPYTIDDATVAHSEAVGMIETPK